MIRLRNEVVKEKMEYKRWENKKKKVKIVRVIIVRLGNEVMKERKKTERVYLWNIKR